MVDKARDIIKQMRKDYGWTQEDFASWIDVDQSTYSKKERGEVKFFADELLALAEEIRTRGHKRKLIKPAHIFKLISP